jgi:hypothetical protein
MGPCERLIIELGIVVSLLSFSTTRPGVGMGGLGRHKHAPFP